MGRSSFSSSFSSSSSSSFSLLFFFSLSLFFEKCETGSGRKKERKK